MFDKLEIILDYKFKDKGLLKEALTHPSISYKNKKNEVINYERLEFLGDSVLGLIIAELLINNYPEDNEGSLAKRHAALVRGDAIADVATKINIGQFIAMTEGEAAMGGRENQRNIENTLEAVIGAIYSDGGIDPAKRFILNHWQELSDKMLEPPKDCKTLLQEWAQGRGYAIPDYSVINTEGKSHSPIFTIRLSVHDLDPVIARGETKKKAEQKAAQMMIEQIEIQKNDK